jgi:hypothetical protein
VISWFCAFVSADRFKMACLLNNPRRLIMVYSAKKNGTVVHRTDIAAMKVLDGINMPDVEITDEKFEAAGSLVRLINKIFSRQNQRRKKVKRDRFPESRLAHTDCIIAKIAEGTATVEEFMYRTWL